MDEIFKQIRGHIQDLESSPKQTVVELDMLKTELAASNARTQKSLDAMRNNVTLAHAATAALGGTFAGIEQILRDHEQRLADAEGLKTRVEALERRQPPAA